MTAPDLHGHVDDEARRGKVQRQQGEQATAHRAAEAVETMARRVEAVDHGLQLVRHSLQSIHARFQPIQTGLNARRGLVHIHGRVKPIIRGFIGVLGYTQLFCQNYR